MVLRISISIFISMLLIFSSCSSQETPKEQPEIPLEELGPIGSQKKKPHRYGGWYCPDNFGFVPVDVQRLNEVPAIANRLPTEEELHNNMSLINVDTEKYPDARAVEMDLPRVARIYSERKGIEELIIVIQAIVVQGDSVVGYRFANGGNGSAWLNDVTFLSENEVVDMGPQPFFYSQSTLKAKTKDIWRAMSKTNYFNKLGKKFDRQEFFSEAYDPSSQAHLDLDTLGEKATGYVGMVFGNYYLHIDYIRDGFHYSEKLLMMENEEDNTTEFFFASGPYPEDFEAQKVNWDNWIKLVSKAGEAK